MIITRLALHRKKIKRAIGEAGSLYKTIITMLVESCAIYATSYLLFIGTRFANSPTYIFFFLLLAQIQVCAVSTFPCFAVVLSSS